MGNLCEALACPRAAQVTAGIRHPLLNLLASVPTPQHGVQGGPWGFGLSLRAPRWMLLFCQHKCLTGCLLILCCSGCAVALAWEGSQAAVTSAAHRKGDFHLVLNYDIILLDL